MNSILRSTRFWVIGLFVVVLVSVGTLAFRADRAGGATAVITRNGQEVQRIDLGEVTRPYTLRLDHSDGGYNLVLVEPGAISVTEASCPDQVCVNQGRIHNSLMPIVCLPNHLAVSIESSEAALDADVVAK